MPKLITVFRTTDSLQANLASSVLEQEDIRCMVRDHATQNLIGVGNLAGYNPLFGAIEILVQEPDAAQARSALEVIEWQNGSIEAAEKSSADKDTESGLSAFRKWKEPFALYLLMEGPTIWLALSSGFVGLAIVFFLLTSIGYLAYQHMKYVHQLGYEWASLLDSVWMRFLLRTEAYKIPPASDLQLVPGFQRNVVYLIEQVKQMRSQSGEKQRRRGGEC